MSDQTTALRLPGRRHHEASPPPPSPPSNNNNNNTFQVKVMTYNIQQLYNYLGPKTWWDQKNRAARIPSAIRSFCCQNDNNNDSSNHCPVDVLILNEAFNSYATCIAEQLLDIFPYQTPVVGKSLTGWTSTTSGSSRRPAVGKNNPRSCTCNGICNCSSSIDMATKINGGVLILSRHEIVEQRQCIYQTTHTSTWDSWANKGIVYAKISIQDNNNNSDSLQMVHVLGTHLQADEGHVPLEETHQIRMEQLREMRNFLIDKLELPKTERVIIGGDLNVEYTRESFRRDLESNLQTTIHYHHTLPGSFSAPHNWMTKSNARSNRQSEDRNETLDYIVVPNDYVQPLQPAVAVVVPLKSDTSWYWSYLAKHWPAEKGMTSDLSDHYPVVATFEFEKSTTS